MRQDVPYSPRCGKHCGKPFANVSGHSQYNEQTRSLFAPEFPFFPTSRAGAYKSVPQVLTPHTIERLNEEIRQRIKTQTVLSCAETLPMPLWALLASGQITMRKVDGWQALDKPIESMPPDLAA